MSALAGAAERPELITRLFVNGSDVYQEDGLYRIRYFKNGLLQDVTIDDYIPCGSDGKPIFSRAKGNELWVMLLEKAYAKIHGGYAALRGGYCNEAFYDITGCPVETYHLKQLPEKFGGDRDLFFKQLCNFDSQGCLMSSTTAGETMDVDLAGIKQGSGLIAGHAYTVVECRNTREGINLIKMRNPWG